MKESAQPLHVKVQTKKCAKGKHEYLRMRDGGADPDTGKPSYVYRCHCGKTLIEERRTMR